MTHEQVRPALIVLCGPPGTGKTTLAHCLARGIGCPVISRDEIKEGIVHGTPDYVASPGDALTQRTFRLFFDVIRLLVEAGASLVAEAAFVHDTWVPELDPFVGLADIRVVRCHADANTRLDRVTRRGKRRAHADRTDLRSDKRAQSIGEFAYLLIDVPTLDVDTSAGYDPSLDTIIDFANQKRSDIYPDRHNTP